jgi:putative transposase
MVKVENRRKLKWCLLHYESGEIGSKWASGHLEITPRRFQQLYKEYKATGKIPDIGLDVGRPKKEVPNEYKRIIKQEYERTCSNAVYLEKTINAKHGIHIPHNLIHQVLLELEYAQHEESKQKRRKPWIRYSVAIRYHWCTWIGIIVKTENVFVLFWTMPPGRFWLQANSIINPR